MALILCSPVSSTTTKWLGLVVAIWVQAIAGNNYTFSNYSDTLKSLLSLSQLQLNNLSVAKDVGKAFGLLAGLASDRWPTSIILMIGALEGLIGYGAQWLVVSQRIPPPPYWQMCIFLCLGGNSTSWMNTAVLVTSMRNFKHNQGPVSGILKGYLGLSTAIFTDLSTALFSSNPSAFLLTLSLAPLIVCSIAALLLHETPHSSAEDLKEPLVFYFLNGIAMVVAFYLLGFDVSGIHNHLISSIFAIGLIILLATPLFVPVYYVLAKNSSISDTEAQEPLLQEKLGEGAKQVEEALSINQRPILGEDHTIVEALKTIEFWVLFTSFLCGVGTGMCVLNNLGQMGRALGYADVSIFVSLTSISGFFGRIISGVISEHYIRKCAAPRPIWNAMSQIVMAVGFIMMAIAFNGSLYIGSVLVGLCYGVRLAVTVPIASELFGLKYFGLLYNVLILNLPLGSFLFSGLLAGYIYDAEAIRSTGGNNCFGPQCYRLVFVIMALTSVLGLVLDLLLASRMRGVYLKIYLDKKYKNRPKGQLS